MARTLALLVIWLWAASRLAPSAQSLPEWAAPAGGHAAEASAGGGPCGPAPCPPPPPPPVPVDGGLAALALAGAGLAARRLRRRRGATTADSTRLPHGPGR